MSGNRSELSRMLITCCNLFSDAGVKPFLSKAGIVVRGDATDMGEMLRLGVDVKFDEKFDEN